MYWNYRIFKVLEDYGDKHKSFSYSIHEVYYDDDGTISAWTEREISPYGETFDEISKNIEMMASSLSKPVLFLDRLSGQVIEESKDEIKIQGGKSDIN